MENQYLRVKEVAQFLGIGISSVWLFSKQKKIQAIKLSDRITVWSKSDLDAFIASRMVVA